MVRYWTAAEKQWQESPPPNGFERNEMFLDEMRHFLDIIGGKTTPLCSLEDGIRVLEIVLAARESASSGCRISTK
jgi:predicted dehydrogenase